jgi:mannose-6-phosphate isomerase-like protein (cupin superfamily)
MRKAALMVLGVVFTIAAMADTKPNAATYVPAADVDATLKKALPSAVSDQPIRMVDAGGYNVGVAVVSRPRTSKQGAPVYHEKVAEIYHVISGSGTLVTGGTLENPKPRPVDATEVSQINGPSVTGTAVHGGETRQIKAGDVVIIPAGVVHWFSEIQESLTYIVIRVDPEKVVPLK